MEEKKNRGILLAVILVVIAGLAIFLIPKLTSPKTTPEPENNVLSNAQKFRQEYPAVSEGNRFAYKSVEQIIEQLESGTGVIYFGFPECQWCQKYVEYLDEVAVNRGLAQISYYNIREIRKENTEQYQKIVALLKDHGLDKDADGNPRVYVPEVVAVKDGKVIARDNTSSLNSTEKDGLPADWWTEERVTEVKKKLQELIDPIVDCGATCQI